MSLSQSLEELLDSDRRDAAIHESGHAVVGALLGLRARAWIRVNDDISPSRFADEKLVLGSAEVWPLTDASKAIIGWGGIVAEALDEDLAVSADEIAEAVIYECLVPSATDWAGIEATPADAEGDLFAMAPLEQAVSLLSRHWDLVQRCAAELVEHGSLTDHDVRVLTSSAPAVAWRSGLISSNQATLPMARNEPAERRAACISSEQEADPDELEAVAATRIHPEYMYSLDGFVNESGLSRRYIYQAKRKGVPLKKRKIGRKLYVYGRDGVEFLRRLAKRERCSPGANAPQSGRKDDGESE